MALLLIFLAVACEKKLTKPPESTKPRQLAEPSKSLHDATRDGDISQVKLHISRGTDVNMKDKQGTTALYWAALYRRLDIARLLLETGADVNLKNSQGGVAPLHTGADRTDLAKLLIAEGADVNAKTDQRWTPLHFAARFGYDEKAKLLVSKGADVNAKEQRNWTPLHFAARFGHKEIVELLASKGANINTETNNGATALLWAKYEGYKEIVELLRKHGADADLRILPKKIDGTAPTDMMKHYLLRQAQQQFEKWKQRYEQLKTIEQVAEYQKSLRDKFLEAIGGLPEKTPLNPQVTGIVMRDDFRVEKVIFESQPKHYVTAALFLPDAAKHKPPYPGVLVPCGHSRNGKAPAVYQQACCLLALNGIAALIFDPIDQGERSQMPSQLSNLQGTKAHTMVGIGSILLGRNTARFEIWDGIRALDYLQSRPEVDPNRIGCTGNSGGGTQTSYLMALDDRIRAAAPSCYITSFERLLSTVGPQDAEQNIFGQLAFGMDHANYLLMRAPKPTLICAATNDYFDIEGTWASFRYAKRLYTRLEFAERVNLIENDDKHGFKRPLREAAVRWMARWLLGKDEPITEPPIKVLTDEEIQCTPQGQVMFLEQARSTYDLNRDFEEKLAKQRKKLWKTKALKELQQMVCKKAGIRELNELPKPTLKKAGIIQRNGYQVKRIILKPEDGVYLPALMFVPDKSPQKATVLYVHQDGKSADATPEGPIEELVKSGKIVLAVDLRGTGETLPTEQKGWAETIGFDWKDYFTAYLLGRSYVGMRAEDILVCARFLQEQQKGPVDLVAIGHVCVPALHAAAVEPNLFGSIKLIRGLISWSNVIELGRSNNQLVNTVHGALTAYDLPDLARTLETRLTIEQPLNALGEPIQK